MTISFARSAWEDYVYWQENDKRMVRRINELIESAMRQPFEGLGKPEPLRHEWSGWWSRRIDQEHRLVFRVTEGTWLVAQCRYHY